MKTSTSIRKRAGRKLNRIITEDFTVTSVINIAIDKCNGSLIDVGKAIDYRYTSLWAVYRGERPMPPLIFQKLCHFAKIDSNVAFEVLIMQCVLFDKVLTLSPIKPKKPKQVKHRIRKKAVPKVKKAKTEE